MGKNRGHSEGIRGAFGGIRGQVRAFWFFQYCMELGFRGSSEANPGGKYPLYNIKVGKEKLLADCGAKILLEAI